MKENIYLKIAGFFIRIEFSEYEHLAHKKENINFEINATLNLEEIK